jgi:hypothetical protein
MDLLRETGRTFHPMDKFIDDQPFYAQVKDDRVPDKKGQVLLHGMGINSRGALSEYRSFLKLPPLVWQLGDEYNWSRERLYELSKLPSEEAIEHARLLRNLDERVNQDVLSQNISRDEKAKKRFTGKRSAEGYLGLDTKAFRADATRVARTLASSKSISPRKREEVLDVIEKLHEWLNEAEKMIKLAAEYDT